MLGRKWSKPQTRSDTDFAPIDRTDLRTIKTRRRAIRRCSGGHSPPLLEVGRLCACSDRASSSKYRDDGKRTGRSEGKTLRLRFLLAAYGHQMVLPLSLLR